MRPTHELLHGADAQAARSTTGGRDPGGVAERLGVAGATVSPPAVGGAPGGHRAHRGRRTRSTTTRESLAAQLGRRSADRAGCPRPAGRGPLGEVLAPGPVGAAARRAARPRRRAARLLRADDLGGRAEALPTSQASCSRRRSAARTSRRSGTRRTRSRARSAARVERRPRLPLRARAPRRAPPRDAARRPVDAPGPRAVGDGACVILGVGAPPLTRAAAPALRRPRRRIASARRWATSARASTTARGDPVPFPGTERLMATRPRAPAGDPDRHRLAAGAAKVPSILAAAARATSTSSSPTPPPPAR